MKKKCTIDKEHKVNSVNYRDYISLERTMKIAFWEVDIQNRKIYFSEGWHELINNDFLNNEYSVDEFFSIVHMEDVQQLKYHYSQYIKKTNDDEMKFRIKIDGEKYKWVRSYGLNKVDIDGKAFRLLGFVCDLSNEKRLENKLHEIANTDPITGLHNLNYLENILDLYTKQVKQTNSWGALLYINMSNLKMINDSYGFKTGNKLLTIFAETLEKCVRNNDVIAKVNGDEFAILLMNIFHESDIASVVERIIDATKEPTDVDGKELYVTLHIGITIIKDDKEDKYEILRRSHSAANRARHLGKNKYMFYAKEDNENFVKKVTIENDLRHAIENEEFELYYQPKVRAVSRELCGFEALIRWKHPIKGIVSPIEFIPIAEESDLIIPLGNWIISTACKQCKKWDDMGLEYYSVAVNISPKQFLKGNLVEQIENALNETGLQAKHLELEITESALISSIDITIKAIEELRNLGVKISLDDFGTGYSSLSYLRKLPIDRIKIDKSFIQDIYRDEKVEAIISAIIVLSKTMKLEIVAEGVENTDQLEFLVQQGCHQIQGYLFSKPETASDIQQILVTRNIKAQKYSSVK